MGLYLKQALTADVVTLQPSVLYRLSAEALLKMEAEEPQTAAALREWLARMLAE